MKFKFLTGDANWREYGAKWVSNRLNNGEFDYWIVLEFINWYEDTGDESGGKYVVSLQAVSPEQVSKENMESAFASWGFEDESLQKDPLVQVEALSDYGIFAQLWSKSGNNAYRLLRDARKQAQMISFLFGFYMDRPENRIGQTGWDRIRGQDVREFLTNRE